MYLNLLVLRCENIDESKAFYEKLSLNFVKEQHENGPIHYATKIDDMVLELYPLSKDTNIDNTRLGFNIDVEDIHTFLTSYNMEVISVYSFDGIMIHVVQDPDGRKVELSGINNKVK